MNKNQFRDLSNNDKRGVANKLNFPNLRRLSHVSRNMRNVSIPVMRAKKRNRNTNMITDMMKVSRLPQQRLALNTWNKEKLAAYISAYHSGNAVLGEENAEGLWGDNGERPLGGAAEGALFLMPNGSMQSLHWAPTGSSLSGVRPPGTFAPIVHNLLSRVNNSDRSTLKAYNRFRLYRALMRQNKPELINLAKIIHGGENQHEWGPPESPQFGQKWRRLSRYVNTAAKLKGIHKNIVEKRYAPGGNGYLDARNHFQGLAGTSNNNRGGNRN